MDGWREGGREGGSEGGREGAREGAREGGREGHTGGGERGSDGETPRGRVTPNARENGPGSRERVTLDATWWVALDCHPAQKVNGRCTRSSDAMSIDLQE